MMTSLDPADFLAHCDVIDTLHPAIVSQAELFANDHPIETVREAFTFVRDEIHHSSDCKLNPVTCRASDVLRDRTGYCYAKSHLLAAILRANGIPTGLCYQRIARDSRATSFCLHGLNAVFLRQYGWYHIDARGNRDGINAQFDPPHERLAFTTDHVDEYDVPGIFVSPMPSVVQCLTAHHDWADVYASLPDLPAT